MHRSRSDKSLPKNKKDKKLSMRHLRDSIKFNREHKKDHEKAEIAAMKHLEIVKRV